MRSRAWRRSLAQALEANERLAALVERQREEIAEAA